MKLLKLNNYTSPYTSYEVWIRVTRMSILKGCVRCKSKIRDQLYLRNDMEMYNPGVLFLTRRLFGEMQ